MRDIGLGGVHVEAGTPLVVSFGGANNDPTLTAARQSLSKGAQLAWGAGPHSCPAKSSATVIAQTAIEAILNALPDLALDVSVEELQWRPGPFHRALAALPVRFTPTPGTRVAAIARTQAEANTAQPARAPVAPAMPPPTRHQEAEPAKKGLWSTFLDIFRV